ncbi:MAG TPA: mevalonate kinase [Nitrososphaerales archaeon]
MLKAIAEAPSKVIITGEHFVVHGAWALAAALPRGVRVEMSNSTRFEVTSDRFALQQPELKPVGIVVEEMAREFSANPRVKVSVSSAVPQGAGLGSSASTMVAVASAFSRLNSLGLGHEEIARYSMAGERAIHGMPSGIDSAICSHGGVLLFRTGRRLKKVSFAGQRSLIVSYSGQSRSTKGQIGRVSSFKETLPGLFSILSDSVSDLSLRAAEALAGRDMRGLGRVLSLNQAVLGFIGVSNPALNTMVDYLGSAGGYGAKLTGAGGGGSVVAVAPEAKEKSIVWGLKARGFETFIARVPAKGVRSWLER